ncbi:MAG: TonB-dependent receptor plug domain-containing protein, partial [Spirochaetales bacterium]|nr:TonB-dependent receptor plug domain-containing protein [Spirochaetales bacterium]
NVVDRDLELPLEGVRIHEVDSGIIALTDVYGNVVLTVPDIQNRIVIIAELIGYESRKILVIDFNKPLKIEMLMEGVLEGQELVVEEEAIGETDEEVGVSIVIEKDMIESAAKIGIIEDVMSAIKILPGVIYSGPFGAGISVRGGTVDGLTTVLDGFVVKYPYHWGGAYSIFNPNIVESVKFSAGIFSSKFGQATSGLMEVNTINPNEGFKMEGILSTSTMELFTQVPIGKDNKSSVLGGFRLTNYDIVLGSMNVFADATENKDLKAVTSPITRPPYIYDFYLKTFYRPSDRFEWFLNGFWGNDGIGIETTVEDKEDTIGSGHTMNFFNSDFFVSTNIKIMPSDNLLFHFLIGYEYWKQTTDFKMIEEGTKKYSEEFKDAFGSPLPDSFTINTESIYSQITYKDGIQGRLDSDWSIADNTILQSGFGTILDIQSSDTKGEMWSVETSGPIPEYKKIKVDIKTDETKVLNSFAYFNLDMDLIPNVLSVDLGCRVDHSYFLGADDFSLNTYPVPGPRVNFTFSPTTEGFFFTDNSWSLGAGLFSKAPFDTLVVDKDFGLDDFELSSPKTLMAVIGWDTHLPSDFHFKIETYYKYIFDRFYINLEVENADLNPLLMTDGIGHAAGGDLLIERKSSRYIDGMLSYSFVYARYLNPETYAVDLNLGGSRWSPFDNDPRGEWYYPSFHRFNSLNLLLDMKPFKWFTFTTKLSFATGTPRREWEDDKEMYGASVENADGSTEIAELYNRASEYSDTFRTNWILALDLKISLHNYRPNSKIEWEFYIAAENILAPLMTAILPNDSVDLDKWNGEEK